MFIQLKILKITNHLRTLNISYLQHYKEVQRGAKDGDCPVAIEFVVMQLRLRSVTSQGTNSLRKDIS